MAKKKNNKKKSGFGFRWIIVAIATIAFMIMFMATTLLIVIGMLPTFVAIAVDREPGKNKSFTIGAMNFAGCFPYLLELWTKSNSVESAISYIADPKTIIIIYSVAALGYLINHGVTIVVSSILVQRSRLRIKKIEDEKLALEERWGKKVNGKYNLDENGFIIQKPTDQPT